MPWSAAPRWTARAGLVRNENLERAPCGALFGFGWLGVVCGLAAFKQRSLLSGRSRNNIKAIVLTADAERGRGADVWLLFHPWCRAKQRAPAWHGLLSRHRE